MIRESSRNSSAPSRIALSSVDYLNLGSERSRNIEVTKAQNVEINNLGC